MPSDLRQAHHQLDLIVDSSSLRNAFEALYGYTNDKNTGIRHALMDDVHASEAEEAIFMLVS